MELIREIFGEGKELSALQMGSRAVVMFVITIVLIRIAGAKTFGKNAVFDNVIIIMLGAVLSRGVVGANPFGSVVIAGLAMVLINRIVSWATIRSKTLSVLVKGEHLCLYEKGVINHKNLSKCLLSENDLMEGVRMKANTNSLDEIEEIFLECNGEMSVIKKTKAG
jgi:uncharacterized membrane protein YcaP (DUF421 family)